MAVLALAVAIIISIVLALSARYAYTWQGHTSQIGVGGGVAHWVYYSPGGFGYGTKGSHFGQWGGPFQWRPKCELPDRYGYYAVVMPLWMPAIALLGIAAGAAWRSRRRTGERTCGSCGYSLEGLPGGAACPECGSAA